MRSGASFLSLVRGEVDLTCSRRRQGAPSDGLFARVRGKGLLRSRTSALRSSREYGALGVPPRPLARQSGVGHVIDEAVVEPLGLPLDTLSPESQPLRYGATLLIFGRARDDHPVQAEFPEGVLH